MPTKTNIKVTPRKMMELAIEVMRKSIPENRPDGSPSPLVGAVLVRPDGSIETASRGELREGNHAEFILLERKCHNEKLDGCILFTTLEPCVDRNYPKQGCAKHIISARIKTIYVGIEDDNPVVAGKGIEYLRRNGIEVRMFDRDLQEVILRENKVFFEWARKQINKPKEELIKLSRYEESMTAVHVEDLSKTALENYKENLGISKKSELSYYHHILQQQGLLVEKGKKLVPSGFGLLLFGNHPRMAVPHAGMLARVEFPDGTSSRKEFDNALVLIPAMIEDWLKSLLPNTIDRSHMVRKEQVDLPFTMIREAVVNALIHRDYNIVGEKCQLIVNSETITVKSPGGPIPPITLEQMQSFSAPMKSRNPILHNVFARMGLAEEQGYGLEKTLKMEAERLRLPLPSFEMENDYLVLTMYRRINSATIILSEELKKRMSKAELIGWEWLSRKIIISTIDYEKEMDIPNRTAKNQLRKLTELGLLKMVGSGRSTKYIVIRPKTRK